MKKYPTKKLHPNIRNLLSYFVTQGYTSSSDIPEFVIVRSAEQLETFAAKPFSTPVQMQCYHHTTVIENFSVGMHEGTLTYGRVGGGRANGTLSENMIIVRGYYCSNNAQNRTNLCDVEVIFHPKKMLKLDYPEVPLNERERRILFCFGVLKEGYLRREALYKLDVAKPELQVLVDKKVLRKQGRSYCVTSLGEANRNFFDKNNPAIDQW